MQIDADREYSSNPTNTELFQPRSYDEARKNLHLDGKEPPALEEVLLPYNAMMGDRQTTIETARGGENGGRGGSQGARQSAAG